MIQIVLMITLREAVYCDYLTPLECGMQVKEKTAKAAAAAAKTSVGRAAKQLREEWEEAAIDLPKVTFPPSSPPPPPLTHTHHEITHHSG